LHGLRQPGGPHLGLPLGQGGREEPRSQARAMYRSTFHWRPLLNGYSSYWPSAHPRRMQLARRLPDPDALQALRAETGLEMILVHAAEVGSAERASGSAGPPVLRPVARAGEHLPV